MKTPTNLTHAIHTTVTRALDSVNNNGTISPAAARSLFRTMRDLPVELRLSIALAPEKYFGPFEFLPVNARDAIVQAISNDDKWRMAGYQIGNWHLTISRFFWKFKDKLTRYNLIRLKSLAEILAIIIQSGPAHVVYAMYQLQHRLQGQLSSRPKLHSVLNISGIEPRNLAVCYAQKIPQPEAHRGFWHDSSKHNTYGVVLGIDLIPTSDGCWYIESNLNCGMSNTRSALYDQDPFVKNLISFTAENGYRHLMIVYNKSSHMNKFMVDQFNQESLDQNIRLTIVEDAYLAESPFMQSFKVPAVHGENTLIVRTKCYRTSLDYLFDNKVACQKALALYKSNFTAPSLLLPASAREPLIDNVDATAPFPNLVYKLPERDAGKGVFFLKATSPDHAVKILAEAIKVNRTKNFTDKLYSMIENHDGLYQQYIRSPLLAGRLLYKVRSHVLITPVGIRFLSAHRVISRFGVPEELPFGMVNDAKPYLVNLSSSSAYEIVPPDEEQSVINASLAIAEGLEWAAAYGFQTNPS